MVIKKRSIISALLIISMVFTAALFTSCNDETESVESITVSIIISGSETNPANSNNDTVLVEALPSEMTVLTATRHFCEVMDIDFVYDSAINSVKQIGSDIFDDKALGEELREEEMEEAEAAAAEPDSSYYDWQSYINGNLAELNDKIKEGDKIEWKWEKFIPEDI